MPSPPQLSGRHGYPARRPPRQSVFAHTHARTRTIGRSRFNTHISIQRTKAPLAKAVFFLFGSQILKFRHFYSRVPVQKRSGFIERCTRELVGVFCAVKFLLPCLACKFGAFLIFA